MPEKHKRCTAVRKDGFFCRRLALPATDPPLCLKHQGFIKAGRLIGELEGRRTDDGFYSYLFAPGELDEIVSASGGQILIDIGRFSFALLRPPLYRYQVLALRPLLNHLLNPPPAPDLARQQLLLMPRGAGLTQTLSQVLVYLLNVFAGTGGKVLYLTDRRHLELVKTRILDHLDNPFNVGHWHLNEPSDRLDLGRAVLLFKPLDSTSDEPLPPDVRFLVASDIAGPPPDALRSVSELGRPPLLYAGHVASTADWSWRLKAALETAQELDGISRVYSLPIEQVVAENIPLGVELANLTRDRGRNHPAVASAYFLEPYPPQGCLFDARMMALMDGDHLRRRSAPSERRYVRRHYKSALGLHGPLVEHPLYVATLAQDGTTIDTVVGYCFELMEADPEDPGPTFWATDMFITQAEGLFRREKMRRRALKNLLAWLRSWQVAYLVLGPTRGFDPTAMAPADYGFVVGMAIWLAKQLAAALPDLGLKLVPGTTRQRSRLGSDFIALVELGRFLFWDDVLDFPLTERRWFFEEARLCRYIVPPGLDFDRHLRWGVPPGTRIDTSFGPREMGDQRLFSASLSTVFDDIVRQGHLKVPRSRWD